MAGGLHCELLASYIHRASLVVHTSELDAMPDSCCAVGCSNVRGKGERLSFYRIPFGTSQESSRRRLLWVNAIRRKGWTEEMIDNARICSAHFISGKI